MITVSIENAACIVLTPELATALQMLGEDISVFNRLRWPAGATNHAEGVFLVHSDEAAKLTAIPLTQSITVSMNDDSLGEDGNVVADRMYQIEHRPIHVRVGTDGSTWMAIYAVKLVDERYFWGGTQVRKQYNVTLPWDRSQYYGQSKNSGTAWTWAQVVADVCAATGLSADNFTNTVDTTGAGTPNDIVFYGESAAEAIDRICASLGAVFTAQLYAASPSRYIIQQPVNLNPNALKHNDKFLGERVLGGVVWSYGGPVKWLEQIMPSSVTVYFPRQLPGNLVDSQASSAPPMLNRFYTQDSTAGKPAGATGRAGYTVAIYDSMWALGSIGSETNATALIARADFLAGAYYQRFWVNHSQARMRGFEKTGPVPGVVSWQLHVDGPYTDILTNGMWAIYGGGKDVLGASKPPRIVGMGDVQTWETFDGSTYVGSIGNTFQARITAASGSFPAFSYTVQRVTGYNSSLTGAARWVTDGVDLTAINRCEFSGTPTYAYGTGNDITDTDGTVNGGSCKVIAIGVGSVVDVRADVDVNGGSAVYSFYAANSAQ